MANKKSEVKKEIYQNIRSISILCLSITLIFFDFSLAKLLNFTDDKKIIWALDFGIYNSLFSIIFSIVNFYIKGRKLLISVDILNKREEVDVISLTDDPSSITINIEMEGTYKKIPYELEIKFPEWIDTQVNTKPFLSTREEDNTILVNLEYFIRGRKNVSIKKAITVDIICNDDEKVEELVEAKLKIGFFKKITCVHFENQGIKMKRK